MCNSNNSLSIKDRIFRPYERFRDYVFNLPRPISIASFSPEMVADWEYLKKHLCSNKDCGHDECLFIRGILDELNI